MPTRAYEFLTANNINTVAVMSRIANDEQTVIDKWAKKYIDGATIGSETFKSTDDADVTNAYFIATWEDCVASRKASQATALASIPTAGHGASTASTSSPTPSSILAPPTTIKDVGQARSPSMKTYNWQEPTGLSQQR